MIAPNKLNHTLKAVTHAEAAEYEFSGEEGTKKYTHYLEFSEYRTLSFLRQQITSVSEETGAEVLIKEIEPTIHVSGSSIEARLRVTVAETEDRFAHENKLLSEYESA